MDVVEIYRKCGDFQKTVELSGLKPLQVHIKLLGSGILKIQDKIKYGSKATMLGGKAEELFQKLVPEAIDANKFWKKNNPDFDFMYKNVKIDVKYSSVFLRGYDKSIKTWKIRVKGSRHIIVAFLEYDVDAQLDNPFILVIPTSLLDQTHLELRESREIFKAFKVEPGELKKILDEYNEFCEE